MIYHRYRFGFFKNIKVFICKKFGHRINENPKHHWCERCGLAYSECYYPKDYFVESGMIKVSEEERKSYFKEQKANEEKYYNELKQKNKKRMKNTIIILLAIIAIFVLNSFTETKPKAQVSIDTKTFISNNAIVIKKHIDTWSVYGYKVVYITPQSVSTSINSVDYKSYCYNSRFRDVKGDIILVMQK